MDETPYLFNLPVRILPIRDDIIISEDLRANFEQWSLKDGLQGLYATRDNYCRLMMNQTTFDAVVRWWKHDPEPEPEPEPLPAPSCENCRYWKPLFANSISGLCRAEPPQFVYPTESNEGGWPTTTHEDRCGAWSRAQS